MIHGANMNSWKILILILLIPNFVWATDGCTDPVACNFNPEATADDGSCLYPDCWGQCGGMAVVDDCGICCGGFSGVECSYWNHVLDFGGAYDCAGDCFGSAQMTECGCAGGSTGLDPLDCIPQVRLHFEDADEVNHTVELWIENYTFFEILSVRIEFSAAVIFALSSGALEEYGFAMDIGDSWFQAEGQPENPIPTGDFHLSTLSYFPDSEDICVQWAALNEGFPGTMMIPVYEDIYPCYEFLGTPEFGCTDPAAVNYNPFVQVDDGSCAYPEPGDLAALQDMTNLLGLDLDPRDLGIQRWTGSRLTEFIYVGIMGPQMLTVPASIGNLTALERLDLSANQILHLPEAVGALSNLESLYLDHNRLQDLPSAVDGWWNLQFLSLEYNELSQLPGELMSLTELRYLNLDHNELTDLPFTDVSLDQLHHLSMSFNEFSDFPEALCSISALDTLNLTMNNLTELADCWSGLEDLRFLSFSYNNLLTLPESIGALSALEQLFLNSNELELLPQTVGDLQNLNVLALANNNLISLPASIGNLSQLDNLSLRQNQLSILPDEFGQLDQLLELTLAQNSFTQFPPALLDLELLQHLSLSDNQLMTLPENIHLLENLEQLFLESNHLIQLPEGLGNMAELDLLMIEDNYLFCDGDYINPELIPDFLTDGNIQDIRGLDDQNCPVSGCTDPLAVNFNPFVLLDDGSCEYDIFWTGPTWYVAPDGMDGSNNGSADFPFATIQHAINTAVNGDTVRVANGHYFERINFEGKNILVTSEYLFTDQETDIHLTIIDGEQAGSVAIFNQGEGPSARLHGFKIINGSLGNQTIVIEDDSYIGGGGLTVLNASPTLTRLVVEDCQPTPGAGDTHGGGMLILGDANPLLQDVTISGCAAFQGGGIFTGAGAAPQLQATILTENSAVHGGGLYVATGAAPNLNDVQITYNMVQESGGGIACGEYSQLFGTGLTILHNNALYGGGLKFNEGVGANLNHILVAENLAAAGGGLHSDSAQILLDHLTMAANEAATGGGLQLSSGNGQIINSIIWDNENPQIDLTAIVAPAGLQISFSDIQNGMDGVLLDDPAGLQWLEGNLDADPQFRGDYMIGYSSPCIDAGDPNSPLDLDGSITDQGWSSIDFSESAYLYLDDLDPEVQTARIFIQNSGPVTGFQFQISGLVPSVVTAAESEVDLAVWWNFHENQVLVVGVFFEPLPAGEHHLATIEYIEPLADEFCISNAVVVGEGVSQIPVQLGGCLPLIVMEPQFFVNILNGHQNEYTAFNDSTGLGILAPVIIDGVEGGDLGDEIGLLDYNGRVNYGDCSDELGPVLVGAGVWRGEPLTVHTYGALDFCDEIDSEIGQFPGWIEGNPVTVLLWRAAENRVYLADLDTESGLLSWSSNPQLIPGLLPATEMMDINQDGEVNVIDIVLVVGYILDDYPLTDQQILLADANQDGSITILDLVMMVESALR